MVAMHKKKKSAEKKKEKIFPDSQKKKAGESVGDTFGKSGQRGEKKKLGVSVKRRKGVE